MQPTLVSIAQRIFHDARPGESVRLQGAGTTLENPYVFDAVAREIKDFGTDFGGLDVVDETKAGNAPDGLITAFAFRRK